MNRRTYIASVAALTTGPSAGCIGYGSPTSDNRMRKTVSVSDVERTTPESIENVDEDEKPTHLKFGVVMGDETITADSTARVTLTYTNGGDDALKLNINPQQPDPEPSADENPGIILLSDAYDPERTSDSCWKPEQDTFGGPAVAYQHPIEPGQTAKLPYDVWAAPKQDADCIQPGDYQFDTLYGSCTMTVKRDDAT